MRWRVKGTVRFRSEVEVDRVFEAETSEGAADMAADWAEGQCGEVYGDGDLEVEPEDPAEKGVC